MSNPYRSLNHISMSEDMAGPSLESNYHSNRKVQDDQIREILKTNRNAKPSSRRSSHLHPPPSDDSNNPPSETNQPFNLYPPSPPPLQLSNQGSKSQKIIPMAKKKSPQMENPSQKKYQEEEDLNGKIFANKLLFFWIE